MLVINKIFVDAGNPRQNNRKKIQKLKIKKKKNWTEASSYDNCFCVICEYVTKFYSRKKGCALGST